MKTLKSLCGCRQGIARRGLALVSAFALLAGTLSQGFSATENSQEALLKEDRRILHVLNRLGFGARPGDVERVRAMGLENYINQQLNPERISDEQASVKVKNLVTLKMTTAELYEKFPQPGQLLRQLERRGELPTELAAARDGRTKARVDETPGEAGQMSKDPGDVEEKTTANSKPRDNQEYRRALREYYRQNGLGQPQRIMAELQASRILRAVYSERQLQEVMVDFWSNHFNVFAGKGADRWLLPAYDRDTIRPNAMGKFSSLLVATAQSPAMLFYLDNFQSVSPNAQLGRGRPRARRRPVFDLLMGQAPRSGNNPAMDVKPNQQQRRKRGINENYARELMELHTLGVDGGYTQKDVQEIARCFTGWTIFAPRGGGAAAAALMGEDARQDAGKFFFNARAHDDGEKLVLGHKIPAGGGVNDGLMVLDILARHPSTAKHIATKLVRYFVSDTPPPALVDRVAGVFTKSGGDVPRNLARYILFAGVHFRRGLSRES